MFSLEVNGNPIAFEIYTGSSHTIITMSDWRRLGSPVLSSSKLRLKCYSGNGIGLVGEGLVPVQYNNHISQLKSIVVQDAHSPLLGLQWIRSLKLDLNQGGKCRPGAEVLPAPFQYLLGISAPDSASQHLTRHLST